MRDELALKAAAVDQPPDPGPAKDPRESRTPRLRAGALRFLTDVIVELGFASRERVDRRSQLARDRRATTPSSCSSSRE